MSFAVTQRMLGRPKSNCKSPASSRSNFCLPNSSKHNRCFSILTQQQHACSINTKIFPQQKTLAHQPLANNQRSNPANFLHHVSRNQITQTPDHGLAVRPNQTLHTDNHQSSYTVNRQPPSEIGNQIFTN